MAFTNKKKIVLSEPVNETVQKLENEFDQISDERKEVLNMLTGFVESQLAKGEKANLIFICTHNSRRSHMAQIWAQTAASYYDIPKVSSYSGGTEATAFNPNAIRAMTEAGFSITKLKAGNNPEYEVRYSGKANPIIAFSKKYDDDVNPKSNFAAIMTCSDADKNCPLVTGATDRIPITYEDPKAFDGTPKQDEMYRERAMQIGREMLYVFSRVVK